MNNFNSINLSAFVQFFNLFLRQRFSFSIKKITLLFSVLFLSQLLGFLANAAYYEDNGTPPPSLISTSFDCKELNLSLKLNAKWVKWTPYDKRFKSFYSMVDKATFNGATIYPQYKFKQCPTGEQTQSPTECTYTFAIYTANEDLSVNNSTEEYTFDFIKHELVKTSKQNTTPEANERLPLPSSCDFMAREFMLREKSLNDTFKPN